MSSFQLHMTILRFYEKWNFSLILEGKFRISSNKLRLGLVIEAPALIDTQWRDCNELCLTISKAAYMYILYISIPKSVESWGGGTPERSHPSPIFEKCKGKFWNKAKIWENVLTFSFHNKKLRKFLEKALKILYFPRKFS